MNCLCGVTLQLTDYGLGLLAEARCAKTLTTVTLYGVATVSDGT